MNRRWENFKAHDRKSLDCLEQTIGRNMGVKDSASEDSGRSEEHNRKSLYRLREYVEILKVLLFKAEKRMRNMSLEIGGKTAFVICGRKLSRILSYGYVEGNTYK